MTGFLPGPDGRPVTFLRPFFSGADLAAGERLVARLRAPGHPIVDQVAPMPYTASLSMFDRSMVDPDGQ